MTAVIKHMITYMKCLYNLYSENMPDMVTDKPYKCTLNFTFALYCFSSAVVGEGNVFRLEFYDIIFFWFVYVVFIFDHLL